MYIARKSLRFCSPRGATCMDRGSLSHFSSGLPVLSFSRYLVFSFSRCIPTATKVNPSVMISNLQVRPICVRRRRKLLLSFPFR